MTISYEQLGDILRGRMNGLDLSSLVDAVIYPNDPTPVPTDEKNATWVMFSILEGDADQADMGAGAGSTRIRNPGVATAAIHSPLGKGGTQGRKVADLIVPQFRLVTVSGIVLQVPTARTIGQQGKWWRTDVVIPFYFDTFG